MSLIISPDNLRYTQDSISCVFKNGRGIERAIIDVAKGVSSVHDFPLMEVYSFAGKFWCRNNRRLYVMKELQRRGHLKEIIVDYVGEKSHNRRYFSTITAGKSIRVRRGQSRIAYLQFAFPNLTITDDEDTEEYDDEDTDEYDDEDMTNMMTKILTNMMTKILTNMMTKILTNMMTKILTNMMTKILTNMMTKILTNMMTKILMNMMT
uniref:uncharacterized protein LOC120343852 n=1 Tax=Styela clava TaxID=7725 RepID=UPI00193AA274|nr:uncharacterized protein LOC120343852 [Styela clava]